MTGVVTSLPYLICQIGFSYTTDINMEKSATFVSKQHILAVTTYEVESCSAPSSKIYIYIYIRTCKSTYPDQFEVTLQGKEIVERGGGGKANAFQSDGKIVLTLSHE